MGSKNAVHAPGISPGLTVRGADGLFLKKKRANSPPETIPLYVKDHGSGPQETLPLLGPH